MSVARRSAPRHRPSTVDASTALGAHASATVASRSCPWLTMGGRVRPPTRTIGRGKPAAPKAATPTRQAARRLAPETRLMCLLERAAGVLCRPLRLRMASTRRPGVDTLSRCPHVLRGPRRLWSRWPLRAARAGVSRHASASHEGSAVRACLGPYRARARESRDESLVSRDPDVFECRSLGRSPAPLASVISTKAVSRYRVASFTGGWPGNVHFSLPCPVTRPGRPGPKTVQLSIPRAKKEEN